MIDVFQNVECGINLTVTISVLLTFILTSAGFQSVKLTFAHFSRAIIQYMAQASYNIMINILIAK